MHHTMIPGGFLIGIGYVGFGSLLDPMPVSVAIIAMLLGVALFAFGVGACSTTPTSAPQKDKE